MEDHLEVTISTREVAEAFEVKPVTVSSWVAAGRLRGAMPRRARKLGRKFKIRDVLLFAQCADDDGASEEQLRRWWEERKDELTSRKGTSVNSTDVLGSST